VLVLCFCVGSLQKQGEPIEKQAISSFIEFENYTIKENIFSSINF
jgi:hypothetical protein